MQGCDILFILYFVLFFFLTRKLYVSKDICGQCIWSVSPDIDNWSQHCLAPSGNVRSLHIILACLYNQTKKQQIINIKLSPTMQWEVPQFLNTDCLAPSGIVRSLHIILACLYNQTKKNQQHKLSPTMQWEYLYSLTFTLLIIFLKQKLK